MPVQDELYQTLYRAWKSELTGTELRKINDSSNFLSNIRQMYQNLSKVVAEETKPLGKDLYKKLLYNIHFMLNDLLELRTEKILCSAKQGKKIDESLLLDLETEYYRSLFTAYKGVNKYRSTIFLPEIITENESQPIMATSSPGSPIISSINNSTPPVSEPIISQENEPIVPVVGEKNVISPIPIVNSVEVIEKNSDNPKNTLITDVKSVLEQKNIPTLTSIPKNFIRPSIYSTVRIIKTTPPLVGEDFEIYGPFKEEDIIYIPQRNAEILIEEKVAKAFLH